MISAIGISVVDHISIIDGFKDNEGTFGTEKYFTEGGGMAATAMCAASKLGSKTRLFTRIGDDLGGKFIIEGLKVFGVDISGIRIINDKNSAISFVFVDSRTGEKQFYSEKYKSAWEGETESDLSLLVITNVLLVDGHWIEFAVKACEKMKKEGVPVVADFKRMYPGLKKLFPFIDYFLVPKFFASEITGESNTEQIFNKLTGIQAGIPVITSGPEGGLYLERGKVKKYRPFPVDIVDSTGAGDAFHGAFCHFLEKGLSSSVCLEAASAVGALNCRAFGGRKALPSSEELIEFLRLHNSEILPEIEKIY